MAEEIAAAAVRIIPDFSTFDAAVLAHATQAARTIEGALAKVNIAGGAGGAAGGLAGVPAAAAPAAAGLDKVKKSSDELNKSIKSSHTSLSGFNTLSGQTARFLLPLSLAFGALAFKAVQATSAIVEAVNAVNVAFGESSGEIQVFARNLQDTNTFFGLTQRAALDAAATFGLFLNDIIKSEPVLANLSEQLITAAADVGSLFNVQTNKVIKDFQSGLAGQTRAVRKYGLDISEATTKQEAFRLGLAETGQELTEEDKRISRLSLILHGSAVAAGDAEITQNTFAGALRNTQVELGGAINQLGQQLLPIAQRVVEAVGFLAKGFSGLDVATKRLFVSFGAFVAVLGPTLLIGSKLAPLFTAAIPAVYGFAAAVQTGALSIQASLGVLGLLAAAIGALVFVARGTTELEETGKRFQQLNQDSLTLAKGSDELRKSAEALGITTANLDLSNFTDFAKAIDEVNTKEFERVPGLIETVGEVAKRTLPEVFGEFKDPAEGLDLVAESITKVKKAIEANQPGAAKAFIDSVTDAGLREKLLKVYEEELRLLAERKVKQDAANKAADEAIQLAIAAIDPTEKLNKLFAESVQNLDNLLTAQTSLTSAEKSLRTARTASVNAQEKLNKLLREGKFDLDKIKNAEDALIDVTNRRTEADREVIRVRTELADLQKPATAEEVTAATDNITKAEIALARAQRARLEAEKALEPHERTRLNLAGLTLDQLRATLANERATLAAQRQRAASGDDPKSKAEDAVLAGISEREAENDLADARANLTKVNAKGTDSDQAVIDKRDELTRATVAATKASREEVDARAKLAEVKAGDPEFEQKVADARQAIADAGNNAADAADRLRDANIKLIEQEGILGGKLTAGNDALAARLVLNHDLLAQNKNNEEFIRQFTILLANTSLFPHPRGPGGGGGFADIRAIALSLINDPNSPFREIFNKLGIQLAEGAVLDRPTFALIGEAGREAVIPFTKPKRAATLLVGAREFPAIEEQIAKIRVTSGAVPAPTRAYGSGGNGLTLDRPETEVAAVLREILAHLQSRPLDGPPITVHPTPGMSESQLARKVQRELQRYWGSN